MLVTFNIFWTLEIFSFLPYRAKRTTEISISFTCGLATMHRGHVVSQGPLSLAHVWQQPPRLLIVDAACPSWARVCSNLCEALQNFFSLACSLEGPTRVPLFSMYVVQSRHECILPFVVSRTRRRFLRGKCYLESSR